KKWGDSKYSLVMTVISIILICIMAVLPSVVR
ncbi:unnamed protein product, partial [marine sediment metagenome]